MSTDFVSEARAEGRRSRSRRTWRARAVSLLGPVTVVGGLLWALWQPYRITLLHPRGQGFWFLLVEPPLLVILLGILFQLVLVPSLLEDLGEPDE